MSQILRLWNSLNIVQRVSVVIVPVVLAVVATAGLKWKHESDFRVLYSGLTPADASAVTQKIKESGIEYRLDETGSTVSVQAEKLAEARLTLAGEGMPRSGRIGFELFDRTDIGVSDFAEQVNYQRAIEGELERTVETLSEVEQARVHVSPAKDSVFLDSRQPAKATVVLKLRHRSAIRQSSVAAVANLLAGAVDGLAPEAVSIIDDEGRLLNRPRAVDAGAAAAEAGIDYRKQIESDLLAKLNAALEPLLGAGKYHAGISVECDYSTVDQNEELYDASKPVTLSSQTVQESNAAALTGGTPGTASNLPAPPSRADGTSGGSRRTENLVFQPNRTVRHTLSPQGSIRRVSTVVLVDQSFRWEGAGSRARKIINPPSPELLKTVHDLAAGIVAFSEQRGDQLTVETQPFDSTVNAEPPPAPAAPPKGKPAVQPNRLLIEVGSGAAAAVLLGGGLFMARRRRTRRSSEAQSDTASGSRALPGSSAESGSDQVHLQTAAVGALGPAGSGTMNEDLLRSIRDAVQKDPATSANILRAWITGSGQGA